MPEWPVPPAPAGEARPPSRRDLRRRLEDSPGDAPGPVPQPDVAEREDDHQSARILQWPGPRTPPSQVPDSTDEPRTAFRRLTGRRALVPAAVVLAAWAATCLVDGVRPELLDRVVVAAASVSTVAVVAAIPVVTLAIMARHWVTAAVATLAALVPWVFVLGYALPGGGAATGSGTHLSVMVLDADAGQADAPSVVAAVARQPVDVLVVTEATGLLTHRLTTSGLDPRLRARWASLPVGSALGGICVYSRYRVTGVEPVAGTRWPAARITLDTGRGLVGVIAGQAWPAANGTDAWRADLAALRASARRPGPTVLAGTLDASAQQPAFRRLTSSGLQDAAAVLGRGVRPTWPSWSPLPLVPLDHVLVGGGVGVRWIGTVAVAGTSHRALVADLVVPSVDSPPSPVGD
jgi:hypothetical protein